jgi:hypothetical protein
MSDYKLFHLHCNARWITVFITGTLTDLKLLKISGSYGSSEKISIKFLIEISEYLQTVHSTAYITQTYDPHDKWLEKLHFN